MKKVILTITLIFTIMPIFSQPEHVKKFLKCGFPRLTDYKCFEYDTINTENPVFLKNAETYNQAQISRRYLTRMHVFRTAAYLVIQNDEVIFENYWLNFNKDSVMNSFSVAKSIVALLLGVAMEDGKIESLNQKVCEFLPEYCKDEDTTLRIIDLLSMSSGLSWSEEFANPRSDIAMAYYGDKLDSLIQNTHVKETPGQKWNYQCGNTVLLAKIIEKATGQSISQYAEEKLWKPLGATHTAYWGKSGDGMTKAFCCFYATPRDFAKLGLLVLHKGKYNGKQIVSEKFIETVTQPANWLTYKKKPVDFYALHFWLIKHHNQQIPYFSGMFGQYIFIFPEQNTVVVRFGEMLNELKIEPLPPDVKLYLKVADHILKENQHIVKK